MFNSAYAATLPIQGSDIAAQWDSLYDFLVACSLFFFVLIVGGMIYFAVKYRRQPNVKTKYITGSHLIEAIWTVIPTILLLAIFGWGYVVYNNMTRSPSDAYEIRVIGKQWLWQFQYDDGRTTVGEVFVPMNRPVKLVMTSDDVLHSFFIPNFRIKQDVVPGMYTSVWFEATVPGKHQVYCTEYCGTAHSEMLSQLVVLSPEQWEAWKKGKDVGNIPIAGKEIVDGKVQLKGDQTVFSHGTLADQGKKAFEMKGCVACHSVTTDQMGKLGPALGGVYDHQVTLADGTTVTADDNYLRESIENPNAKKVKGFENQVMPAFQGMLTEAEMNGLIAYLKSLK